MQGLMFGLFSLKSNRSFLLSSSPNCGWGGFIFSALKDPENQRSPRSCSLKLVFVCITLTYFFGTSAQPRISAHLEWAPMLKAEKVNERQASKRRPPLPSPPRNSNSNKRPPPPNPLEWQWIPLSTNKRLPQVQSFLQSILQKPCFVTSSCFVVSIYCIVANENTTLAENCKNLISAQPWISTNSLFSSLCNALRTKFHAWTESSIIVEFMVKFIWQYNLPVGSCGTFKMSPGRLDFWCSMGKKWDPLPPPETPEERSELKWVLKYLITPNFRAKFQPNRLTTTFGPWNTFSDNDTSIQPYLLITTWLVHAGTCGLSDWHPPLK